MTDHVGCENHVVQRTQGALESERLCFEHINSGPGNRAVLARLAEFLFMDVLRRELRYAAENRTGWLAGLRDQQIEASLGMIHDFRSLGGVSALTELLQTGA